jgi:glycosyltransferase involved in cell wall biosynthesis
MKILIFNWRCTKHPNAGGAEKATFEIAKRWVNWGHEVQLVCGNFEGGAKYDNIDGIKVCRTGGKYSVYPKSAFEYYRNGYSRFDVIVDEINNIPYLTPLFIAKPIVVFIHQIGANMLFEELPYVQAKSWSIIERYLLRLYKNRQIVTSQSTKQDLLQIGLPAQNIHIINYGVNHNLYKPGDIKSPYPHILFFGRLKRFKGVHLIIKAMKKINQQYPKAVLSIVGTGDSDYLQELKQLRTKLNLEDNVVFHELGFRGSAADKVKLLQSAWVSVFPSAREGFGLVVVEANACGTPTIAADVPGLRDTVRDNETGFLVPREVDSLAKSITYVLNDDQLRLKMSTKALAWSKQFDWDITAKDMLDVLQSACKKC